MSKKIVKISQSTILEIPEGSATYVFGSILHAQTPNDCDLLIVYDPKKISPREIYQTIDPFLEKLRHDISLPIDVTCLTLTEEQGLNYIKKVSALKIDKFT